MTIVDLPLTARVAVNPIADLPVAVIGAGPVGLAAAAQLLERGLSVVVLERGEQAGAAITGWGHTRLFSPWEYLVDEAAAQILERAGWERPRGFRPPSGRELVDHYLLPLAATDAIAPFIRYSSTVTSVSRRGLDKTRSAGRESAPFLLRIDGGAELLARAVIDASGTFANPNSLRSDGLPLEPSAEHERIIVGALPDVLGRHRSSFEGRHAVVVGAGHSAANTLIAIAELAKRSEGTRASWLLRGGNPTRVYGSENDELPGRGHLGSIIRGLVDDGSIELIDRFEIDVVEADADGRALIGGRHRGAEATLSADIVVNATGFRPDLLPLREIRLSLDEVVEAPSALAPLIDPNLHSCGSVRPHGVAELAHPEPGFFIAGMKSYGRAPTFLLLTGYEQVRSIADELAGNAAAARTASLELPQTGVCSTAPADVADAGCCG